MTRARTAGREPNRRSRSGLSDRCPGSRSLIHAAHASCTSSSTPSYRCVLERLRVAEKVAQPGGHERVLASEHAGLLAGAPAGASRGACHRPAPRPSGWLPDSARGGCRAWRSAPRASPESTAAHDESGSRTGHEWGEPERPAAPCQRSAARGVWLRVVYIARCRGAKTPEVNSCEEHRRNRR